MQGILNKRSSLSIWFFVLAWLVYTIIHTILKPYPTVAGVVEFAAVNGLIAVIAVYFFVFWRKASVGSLAKNIFLLFALSYSSVFFESSIYHAIYNVLHISRTQLSLAWLSSYNLLYLVYLLFQLLAWTMILSVTRVQPKKSYWIYLPVVFAFVAIFLVYTFATKWKIDILSLPSVYDFSDKILEVARLIGVTLCLATFVNRGMTYFAVGILISAASSMIMDFGLFAQGYGLNSFLETGWVLGKLFMLYGLIDLARTKSYDVRTWIAPSNSIRAQVAYWSFIISIFALVVFFIVTYMLSPKVFF